MKRFSTTLLLFALLFVGLSSAAQRPISGTVIGLEGQNLHLLAYTGLKMDSLAIAEADAQGSFVFQGAWRQGMYKIVADNGFELELLYDGNPVQFVFSDSDDLKTIQFVQSDINRKWSAYCVRRASYRHDVELLKSILRHYDRQTVFYQEATREFKRVQDDFRLFTDSLMAGEDDYAARLIRTDRDLPIDPAQTAVEQRKCLIDNFLKDIDFNDVTIIPTNVLTTKMIDYLSLFQAMPQFANNPDAGFVVGLSRIFEKAKVNPQMYAFVLSYMLEGFTALGVDPVVDYLLNYPMLGEGDVSIEQGLKLDSIAAPYEKVKVGAKAPDLRGTTVDGKNYDLYGSTAKHTIVFFWSTDCEYCHEFLLKIRRKLDLNSDFELVTAAIAENDTEVRVELKQMKLPGYHFYDDLRWESKPFLDYHVKATPTVFVLDVQKIIVLKPYDFEELMDWKQDLR